MSDNTEKMRGEFRAWLEFETIDNGHDEAIAWDVWQHRQPEIDALQARISEVETGLKDAATVRVNMLRGTIANPFKDDCDRLDVLCRENEQLQARNEVLFGTMKAAVASAEHLKARIAELEAQPGKRIGIAWTHFYDGNGHQDRAGFMRPRKFYNSEAEAVKSLDECAYHDESPRRCYSARKVFVFEEAQEVEASRGVVVLPEWSEQDALTLLNADSDGPFGQSDVDSMLAFLGHVNVQISNKAYPATTITAAELDGLRKDAALLPIVVEAALEAAEDWSNYVEEDTAPRVCSEHVKNAIDAAMAGQDAAGGES